MSQINPSNNDHLSEQEKRILDEIARNLSGSDPEFRRVMTGQGRLDRMVSKLPRAVWLALVLVGLLVMVWAVSLDNLPATMLVGLVGFLLMFPGGGIVLDRFDSQEPRTQ